jgi:hypothetical protein
MSGKLGYATDSATAITNNKLSPPAMAKPLAQRNRRTATGRALSGELAEVLALDFLASMGSILGQPDIIKTWRSSRWPGLSGVVPDQDEV